MPTPAAEPTPGPIFVIADTTYRLATAVLAASTLAFLLVLVAGVLAEEVLLDLGPLWPSYLLVRELIGVTILGVVAGAAVIGLARTARQVALGALLIKANQKPRARPAQPDPRGPIGRSPFVPAALTAFCVVHGAIATITVLSDRPDTVAVRWPLTGLLVAAVIAVPLLVLAAIRWRAKSAPRLKGQMAAPAATPLVGAAVARPSARPRSVHWLLWLHAAGLAIFLGAMYLSRSDLLPEWLSSGEIDSVIEIALLIGSGLVVAAVLFTVITRLIRPIRESLLLRRMIAEPLPRGHGVRDRELVGVTPATRGAVLALGAAVWLGELLIGIGRLEHTSDPLLGAWRLQLPALFTGWWVIMVVIIAATAGAGLADSRWRNRARGVEA
ncbi:hypothetical protein [Microlunatus speluncae]|uniref:hypothetical protein n=1 Tax=Microlunatus speluncae TaxID=2594267 RepID=UPI00126630D9|nr:hypothetical protein [Microlunatus speluncae]